MCKIILLLAVGLLIKVTPVSAQSAELQQFVLDVSKLSALKGILQDMRQYYTILTEGYDQIKGIAKGNFILHQTFLDGLLQVSPAVQTDPRVGDIVDAQTAIVQEYEQAMNRFRADPNFSPAEINYLSRVYAHLLTGAGNDLNELTMVLTEGTLRMSDDERLSVINRLHRDMQDKLAFLRYFNNSVSLQSARRTRQATDVSTLKNLYGL